MASLVELGLPAMNHADTLSNRLQEQLECDVRTLEEIWKKLEPLPTPPLSPEHDEASPRADEEEEYQCYDSDGVSEDPLLGELLQCEQLLAYEEEYLSCDSQKSQPDFQASLINQDCLLSQSKTYEPRSSLSSTSGTSSSGMYTPAPSPPPQATGSNDVADNPSADCISPTAVFPTITSSKPDHILRKERPQRRSTVTSSSNTRLQPQALASESDEEIDVVTVVERPKFQAKVNPRKRLVSFSAPCSRQTSPVPSPVKKRRYHTKRLQRLSSVGSNATDGTESDDEQRRASHNVLERKRRNDLKYSFQVLRGQIPDLEENQRAPKVTILRRATDFIKQMQEREHRLEAEWLREKKRKARLMERLAYLKNHFSLCH